MINFKTKENINAGLKELEAKYKYNKLSSAILGCFCFSSKEKNNEGIVLNPDCNNYDFIFLDSIQKVLNDIEVYCEQIETYEGELFYYCKDLKKDFLKEFCNAVYCKYELLKNKWFLIPAGLDALQGIL